MGTTQSDLETLLNAGERPAGESGAAPGIAPPYEAEDAAAAPHSPTTPQSPAELQRILHLSVPVIVKLAEQEMPLKNVLGITVGSIIEFERPFDAELDLVVSNCHIALGQAVKVGENFGLRITRIGGLDEKIKALGA
ncbi:MAG: FliM/FliN family flagellar motor switch protein [Planctomycetota bacterium]|jgi:flagellar motor switch protein FliN/FliY